GTFTDANGLADAADFTVAIHWGDGTTSAGALNSTGAGTWDLTGSHNYNHAGTKTITIDVTGQGGGTASATTTATVHNATLTASSTTLNTTEGVAMNNVALAHFTDANAAASAVDFL